jgi:alginate O-acetyltransferase complex protein AlgI
MIFASFEFLCFFLAVLIVRSCLRSFAAEKWLLLIASYCFYLTWNIPCILLLLFTSVSDFCIGRKLGQPENPNYRRRLLILSLLANLGILGFFKYSNFLLENVWLGLGLLGIHFQHPHYEIVLPPAISYFTFASMSYVIDVYYERISPSRSLTDYSLFVSFFPKLLAGPIMRAGDFLPQLSRRVRASMAEIETGLSYFLLGAVKKLVISDQIGSSVDQIFSTPAQYDSLTLLQGLLGYAVQIYCDFSGYSDMAIGCALILGFKLPENFQMPYSSLSITEFWRRWHITLSAWFRDYVFVPLEVTRKNARNPTFRACSNLTITMLLCGLWHGASWNYVVWGGIHGTSLAIHRVWTIWNPLASVIHHPVSQFMRDLFARLLTLGVILMAWVVFRAQSLTDAGHYLSRMLSWEHSGTRLLSPYIVTAVVAVFLTHLIVPKDFNWSADVAKRALPVRALAYGALLFLLVCFGATDATPFIYFQF